jgi:hypothetical protein
MKFCQIWYIRGADLKKYIFFVLLIFLSLILVGVYSGLISETSSSQSQADSPQSTLESTYQDVQWGLNVQKNMMLLKSDFDNISSATNNSDYDALAVAAQYEINHTMSAIGENDQYKVSTKFQESQKEWRAGLQDYYSAGTSLLEGANEAKSGKSGLQNFQAAAASSSSGTVHLKKMSEALGISVPFN